MAALAERFPHVLNVIADAARDLADALRAIGRVEWLAEERAFDIPFAGDPGAVLAEARKAAGGAAADINVVAAADRRKRLLVADMDSTIIGCECIDELADRAGIRDRIAPITERAMRGELDFAAALKERVAFLKGLPLAMLAQVYAERVRLNAGARALVATMRAHGARTLLVSGGFTFFTSRVAADAGFDAHQANALCDDGTRLTGEVKLPVLGREAKRAALLRLAAEQGLRPSGALAIGDGANDADMVRAAGLGVAWHAKPVLAEAAHARLDHADLTGALFLQGYREAELVRG